MIVFFRKAVAFISAAIALFSALIAIIILTSSTVEDTIKHSHEISKSFLLASDFVERFKAEHGQLPNEKEFSQWAATQPSKGYSARNMQIVTSAQQFPAEVIDKFGVPPGSGYIIELWRGEWNEYFVSWHSASTLEFDRSKYYFLGSAVADSLAIFAFSAVLGVLSRYVRPRTGRAGELPNQNP
jgi:hypothetical protein